MVVRRCIAIALLLAAALSADAAGVVSVKPDRTEIFQNESVNVVFSYSSELKEEPGFDVLSESFDIISQNRRSNLESVDGRFRYELMWTLTLMPKKTGQITVPAVRFDEQMSEPFEITVKPMQTDDGKALGDLYLEVEFTPETGYVQAQFIYTVRLYHRGWLVGGELSEPDFGDADAVIRQLDQVKRYSLFRDSERYQVYEQSYLVFPQSSGELDAERAVFTGKLREPGRAQRLKRVSAPAVSATVLPVPATLKGEGFLPATKLELDEVWPEEPVQFEQGRPVTRKITVAAEGLMAAQLPELQQPELDGLRVYADTAQREDLFTSGGVTGHLEQSVAIVPQRPGPLTLPAVHIDWWDTTAGRARRASLPAREIIVSGAPQNALAAPAAQAAAAGVIDAEQTAAINFWRALTLAVGALWLLTLAAWFWQRRTPRAARVTSAKPARNLPLFKARAAVKKACSDGDPQTAAAALLQLGRTLWPASPPRTLKAMAERDDGPFAEELTRLVAVCYGKESDWADPHRLWRVVSAWRPGKTETPSGEKDPDLAPL